MRIFNKEIMQQNANDAVKPSVVITLRRWMPKSKRYTVTAHSGFSSDFPQYHGFMCKSDAVRLARELSVKLTFKS